LVIPRFTAASSMFHATSGGYVAHVSKNRKWIIAAGDPRCYKWCERILDECTDDYRMCLNYYYGCLAHCDEQDGGE
jgi:hypothetical protein